MRFYDDLAESGYDARVVTEVPFYQTLLLGRA